MTVMSVLASRAARGDVRKVEVVTLEEDDLHAKSIEASIILVSYVYISV